MSTLHPILEQLHAASHQVTLNKHIFTVTNDTKEKTLANFLGYLFYSGQDLEKVEAFFAPDGHGFSVGEGFVACYRLEPEDYNYYFLGDEYEPFDLAATEVWRIGIDRGGGQAYILGETLRQLVHEAKLLRLQ